MLPIPVSKFIPSFANAEVAIEKPARGPQAAAAAGPNAPAPEFYTVPAAREITVLDLLTHTSGVMSGRMSNSAGQAASANRRDEGLKYTEKLG